MSDERPYDQRPTAQPSDPESARPQTPEKEAKPPSCLGIILGIAAVAVAGGLLAFGISNLAKGDPFFGSQEPDVQQQVLEAADEYFGGGGSKAIYFTGTSKLCYDLDAGMTAEQSLVGADPITAAFYTEIAVPIMCPEHR